MSLLFMDGFETDTSSNIFSWPGMGLPIGEENGSKYFDLINWGAHDQDNYSTAATFYRNNPISNKVVWGMLFKPIEYYSGTYDLGILLNNITGHTILEIINHNSNIIFRVNGTQIYQRTPEYEWKYFEMVADIGPSDSTISIYVNDGLVHQSVVSSGYLTESAVGHLYLKSRLNGNAGTHHIHLDDIYVLDGEGSTNNDRLGPVKIVGIRPSAETTTCASTPTSFPRNETIDENGFDDNDYNTSENIGSADLFEMENPTPIVGVVAGVSTKIRAKSNGTGSRGIKTIVNSSNTSIGGHALNTNYKDVSDIIEVSPSTGNALTYTELNNLKLGYKLTE